MNHPHAASSTAALDHYAARAAAHEAAAARVARRSAALTQARVLVFAGAVAAGVAADYFERGVWWWAAAAAVLGFAVLVHWHTRVREREREYRQLAGLAREGEHRVRRAWAELPLRPVPARASGHAYAEDLDVFGTASLSQLIGPAGSALGDAVLEEWLLAAAGPEAITARQAAVRALVPRVEWREELALRARRTRAAAQRDLERFLEWAERPAPAPRRPLHALSWLVPAALWVPLLLTLWLPLPPLWVPGAVAALWIAARTGARARAELDRAFGREALFQHFPALFGAITGATFEDPLLLELQQRLSAGDADVARQLRRLQRIMGFADARYSTLHFALQLGLLWDVHVLRALRAWQRDNGTRVRGWLRAAGEIETLAAFATLAHEQPEWAFADVSPAADRLSATALGHPLLPDGARVHNDVTVGPPGSFLLVTGSNMSGKSTLLRALGLNAVLAQAGAPCCARSLTLPPLAVASSIRVQDSLSRGVSYFMAELERLKQVVDAADDRAGAFLYLLDEILHGTNNAERRIAARQVIAHLVASGAIGAVTTHDLDLVAESELQPLSVPVHFTEDFVRNEAGEERMTFDYTLRPGLAPSTNALKLMELVGLRPK